MEYKKWLVFAASIALCMLLELAYRKPLWEQTLTDVPNMQKKKRLQQFFETIGLLGGTAAHMCILAVVFNSCSKPASLYICASFGTMGYLSDVFKMFYAAERPFWVSDSIQAVSKCHLGFGNPSGHVSDNTFLWFTIFLHFYYDVGVPQKKMSVFCTAYIIKMVLLVAMCIMVFLMAVSRVYVGAHAWNQVLFGFTIGLAFALNGHNTVKPIFYRFWDHSVDQNRYQLSWAALAKVVLVITGFFVLSSVTYAASESREKELLDSQELIDRLVANGCKRTKISAESGSFGLEKAYWKLSMLLIPIGCFVG
jgi:membrane-associated phospholipid phosphatase